MDGHGVGGRNGDSAGDEGGVQEGGRSTGAFAAHLSGATMKGAVLVCAKATVQEGTLMQEELDAGVCV